MLLRETFDWVKHRINTNETDRDMADKKVTVNPANLIFNQLQEMASSASAFGENEDETESPAVEIRENDADGIDIEVPKNGKKEKKPSAGKKSKQENDDKRNTLDNGVQMHIRKSSYEKFVRAKMALQFTMAKNITTSEMIEKLIEAGLPAISKGAYRIWKAENE